MSKDWIQRRIHNVMVLVDRARKDEWLKWLVQAEIQGEKNNFNYRMKRGIPPSL